MSPVVNIDAQYQGLRNWTSSSLCSGIERRTIYQRVLPARAEYRATLELTPPSVSATLAELYRLLEGSPDPSKRLEIQRELVKRARNEGLSTEEIVEILVTNVPTAAGARNPLQANSSLVFRFEVIT